MSSIINLSGISKSFKEHHRIVHVLEDVSIDIKKGEFFVFVGPSGSGKSTILRIMSHLEKEFKGQVNLAKGITQHEMSFVFQQFALLPWLTVAENIEVGLVARGMPLHERSTRVKKEMARLGLDKFATHFPRELSGGMKQRVGIARALVTDPEIVFLDEPFSELDTFIAESLRQDLLALWQERKMTVVMVSHLVQEALELADRIAVFTPRPATIEKVVINTLSRPRLKRSSEFFKLEDEITDLIKP